MIPPKSQPTTSFFPFVSHSLFRSYINMAPTPLSNRAATGTAASSKAPTAAVFGHQGPKPRNQLALLSLSGALLAAPAVCSNPAVAAEVPAPAPITHQMQHISSTTAVKFPSVKAPQGESAQTLPALY